MLLPISPLVVVVVVVVVEVEVVVEVVVAVVRPRPPGLGGLASAWTPAPPRLVPSPVRAVVVEVLMVLVLVAFVVVAVVVVVVRSWFVKFRLTSEYRGRPTDRIKTSVRVSMYADLQK